ncbi:MAG: kelch repeat-containing protein [Chitinophagaceae bacterium]
MSCLKNKYFLFFLSVFVYLNLFPTNTAAQSYGLVVSSHEAVAENRTCLDLTSSGPICFDKNLDLDFDLGFIPNQSIYFGYVFRMVNDKNQNIDFIYNQRENKFQIIFGESFTDINFSPDSTYIQNNWIHLKFSIDESNRISCFYENKKWQSKPLPLQSKCIKLIFGVVNDGDFISRDTPPMKLRNIRLQLNGQQKYFWPLNESSGNTATDSIQHKIAKVSNANWISPRHANWTFVSKTIINGDPSVAFNQEKEQLYIISSDSLYTMSARDSRLTSVPLSQQHTNLFSGNQSVVNPFTGALYNFYVDQKAVLEYNFTTRSWDNDFRRTGVTEYWHANKFFTKNNQLYIIGGYGQLRYKNTVFKYDLITKTWDTLQPQGEFFFPRYLAGLGATSSGDSAYIIGGFGSREGSQMLSPKYLYDLLLFDVRKNSFKKIYSLEKPEKGFVFVNSLIIDKENKNYYGLIFPNDRFNSKLQLIKGSLEKPSYQLMGQELPYSFLDIKSYADLFYCRRNQLLYAVTLYTSDQNTTEVAIYSINFPPNEFIPAIKTPEPVVKNSNKGLYIIAGILLALIAAYFFFRKRNKLSKQDALLPVNPGKTTELVVPATTILQTQENKATAINEAKEEIAPGKSKLILFGSFEVITADGTNISKQFTPLLKEMFLLILIDSLRHNKGVSSEKLNETLWHDKDPKDAKNNRSVNLVKLKNILDKLGDCSINRETGSWKFEYNSEQVYIDFAEYLKVFAEGNKKETHSNQNADKLLSIVKNGAFLQQTHYNWLDTFNAEISNFIIEYLVKYSESLNQQADAEKLNDIANAIFSFDELNEYALRLKCKTLINLGRHTLAKSTFDKFTAKYKEIYGEDFDKSYQLFIE